MKKEAMNLKESREGYMEGARGGKGREKHCNEITISNINNNKNTSKPKSTWKKSEVNHRHVLQNSED